MADASRPSPPRGARWIPLLAFAGLAAVLLAPHASRLVGAGWGPAQAAAVRAHRERAAGRATAEFLKDWSNLVEGRVVGPGGAPIAGATVEIFAKEHLLTLAALPVPEAELVTAADGAFAAHGLAYGSKYVRARAAGHIEHVLEDVVSLDGAGAQDLTLSLEPAAEWTLVLESADGSPIAGERVRVVPQGLLEPTVEVFADDGGRIALPAHLRGRAGSGVWLLVGKPAVTFRVTRATERVQVPPVLPLDLRLVGADPEQPVTLRLVPSESPRLGALTVRATLTTVGGVVSIPGVRAGTYGLAAEQGELSCWMQLHHDGSPRECRLSESATILVKVRAGHDEPPQDGESARDGESAQDGGSLNETVQWRWQPSEPTYPRNAAADRKSLVDQFDPLMRQGTLEPGADLLLERLPVAGWLSVLASEAGRGLLALDAERAEQSIVLGGEPVAVITRLPYLPIHVRTSAGWAATFEANAFGEVTALLPPGPTLVRSRFARGRLSRPKGVWSGRAHEPLRFGLADVEPEDTGATVLGFVHAGGEPVADADVFLSTRRTSKRLTSEHGFYRFDDVDAARARVSARRAGDEDSVLWSKLVELGGTTAEARLDFVLWDGAVELQGCFPQLDGRAVTLCVREPRFDDLASLWRWVASAGPLVPSARAQSLVTDGSARFSGLRPGYYELWSEVGSEDARLLRHFTITGDAKLVMTPDDQ